MLGRPSSYANTTRAPALVVWAIRLAHGTPGNPTPSRQSILTGPSRIPVKFPTGDPTGAWNPREPGAFAAIDTYGSESDPCQVSGGAEGARGRRRCSPSQRRRPPASSTGGCGRRRLVPTPQTGPRRLPTRTHPAAPRRGSDRLGFQLDSRGAAVSVHGGDFDRGGDFYRGGASRASPATLRSASLSLRST